jgi:hypothetical protein
MPKSHKRARVCLDCNALFKSLARDPCPKCGSQTTERVTGSKESEPGPPPSASAPTMVTAGAIPAAPPLPAAGPRHVPVKGGGAITGSALLAAKSKLKKVPALQVPGKARLASLVPWGVRVLLNNLAATHFTRVDARLGREFPRNGPLYYLPSFVLDLKPILRYIAEGNHSNADHAHFNMSYGNDGGWGPLPFRSNPLAAQSVRYFEYGWAQSVSQSLWASWRTQTGHPAAADVNNRLAGFLRTDGGKLNVTRLVVAETGEVFFTPDHYLTFLRYSFGLKQWTPYMSKDFRTGEDADWDASAYS